MLWNYLECMQAAAICCAYWHAQLVCDMTKKNDTGMYHKLSMQYFEKDTVQTLQESINTFLCIVQPCKGTRVLRGEVWECGISSWNTHTWQRVWECGISRWNTHMTTTILQRPTLLNYVLQGLTMKGKKIARTRILAKESRGERTCTLSLIHKEWHNIGWILYHIAPYSAF